MDTPTSPELILDPDYYDWQLLKQATVPQGMFKLPVGILADQNIQLAFIRGAMKDWWTFIDLAVEIPQVQAPDGSHQLGKPMTVKVFKLTELGFQRKRQLVLKFPQDLPPQTSQ